MALPWEAIKHSKDWIFLAWKNTGSFNCSNQYLLLYSAAPPGSCTYTGHGQWKKHLATVDAMLIFVRTIKK